MAVNVLGCLLIGAVMALIADYRALSLQMQYFLVTGILGGFTTFSAFAYETVQLLHSGAVGLALLNIAGNVVVGCAAVWAGHALVRFLWS
jgi:CrcB protein